MKRAVASSMLVICIPLVTSASAFSRWGSDNAARRLKLIQQGLSQELREPADKAQFELLMCRPRRAWQEAEKIKDSQIQQRFFAAILALVAIPRLETADDEPDEFPQAARPQSAIAAKFPFDSDEIWADEPSDTVIPASCDFPLAQPESRSLLAEAAKSHFTLAERSSDGDRNNFSWLALQSDLGLKPEVSEENLKYFVSHHQHSPYLPRLEYFFNESASRPIKFFIQGSTASVSEIEFSDPSFQAHSVELPWLLR